MKKPEKPVTRKINLLNVFDKTFTVENSKRIDLIDNTEYPYFEKWKYLAKNENLPIDNVWNYLKLFRRYYTFNFLANSSQFHFRYCIPSIIQQHLHNRYCW